MNSALRFTADRAGERIDAFLGRVAAEHSRSFWQKQCEHQRVLVNAKPVKANHLLHLGDEVKATLPDPVRVGNHTLPVLYEDDDVLVINKPAGILTHAKGSEYSEFTVADFVRPHTTDSQETNRPGIVHRLDRDTSGVIITAKTSDAKLWLQAQFSKRNVKKTYLALVEGHLKDPEAIVRLPIERNPKKPQTFRVGANGKPAETAYRVEKSFTHHDLVSLQPLTGRTHQLRVHLSYLGHPIVGDPLYGKPNKQLGRMFLHAHILELTLPSHTRQTFTAPLPSELQAYLTALQ